MTIWMTSGQTTFQQGRNGGVMAKWCGVVAFPERGGAIPQPGETWTVTNARENERGNVVFLTLGELVDHSCSAWLNGVCIHRDLNGCTKVFTQEYERVKKQTEKGDVLISKSGNTPMSYFFRRYDTLDEDLHRVNKVKIDLDYGPRSDPKSAKPEALARFARFWSYVCEEVRQAGLPALPHPANTGNEGEIGGEYSFLYYWHDHFATSGRYLEAPIQVLSIEHAQAMQRAAERNLADVYQELEEIGEDRNMAHFYSVEVTYKHQNYTKNEVL